MVILRISFLKIFKNFFEKNKKIKIILKSFITKIIFYLLISRSRIRMFLAFLMFFFISLRTSASTFTLASKFLPASFSFPFFFLFIFTIIFLMSIIPISLIFIDMLSFCVIISNFPLIKKINLPFFQILQTSFNFL